MQCKKRQKKAILAHFILQTRKYTSQLHKVEQRARERVKNGYSCFVRYPAPLEKVENGNFVTAVLLSSFRRLNYQHSGGYYHHSGNVGS